MGVCIYVFVCVCVCVCEATTFPALVVLIPTAYLPTNLAAHVFRLC